MLLPYVDLTKKPVYPKLYLAKPDKTIVARIKEGYNINLHLKLGNISELTFDVPYYLEQNHKLSYNPHIDFCLEQYLIKCVNGNYTEWFTINQVTNYMNSEQEEGKKLHAYSLAYELRNKLIKNYKSQVLVNSVLVDGSVNATKVLGDTLSGTNWTIGYVDTTFDLLYRQFNVTAKTGLDFVYEIATTFGAVVIFDTNLKTVSLYQLNNIGLDRGLRISYRQLLRTMEHTSNPDEMVTRLKPFGKSELTISGVNPTGTDYIEDFSFFLDNYTQDINGNVLTHSRYMSDGLCKAILAYNALVASKQTSYNNLLTQLTNYQTTLTTQKNDLASLNTTLATIQQDIDLCQSTGGLANGYGLSYWLTQQTSQQSLISSKQTDINTTNANITSVNSQITTLQNTLSITTNFTFAQITERTDYIIEKEWTNTNFNDAQSLYTAAVTQFNTLRLPQLVSKIDVVNFLEVLEEQAKWDKLNLGDTISIVYKQVNVNFQAKIVEIQFAFEDGAVTLTISNVQNILTDKQKFIQNLNHSISTSAEVQILKDSWNNIDSVQSSVNQILTQTWDTSKVAINSAVGQSVVNNARGLTIRQTMDSSGIAIPLSQQNKFIRMTNGVIGLTQDGGNTFSVAIDATGVYAPKLVGQILAGTNLTITNSANDFLVNQNGITISKTGTMSQILLNSASGIAIQKNIGTVSVPSWSNVLSLDASGNISTTGNFTMTGGSIIVGGTTLIDATNKIIDFSQFTTKLGRISGVNNVDSINPSQINAGTISASISITSPTINGGTITGVTVTGSTINALNTLYVAANAPTGSYYSNGIQMGVSQSPYVLPATITYTQDQSIALSNLKITSHGDATIYADGAVNLNGIISTQGNMARINNASLSISGSSFSGMGYALSVDGNINMANGCYLEALSDGLRLHFNSTNYIHIGSGVINAYTNGAVKQLAP